MNEVITSSRELINSLQQNELRAQANVIAGVEYDTQMGARKIAVALATVEDGKLYDGQFRTTADFAEQIFGYKRSTVSTLIKTARRFLVAADGEYNIEMNKEYTLSQLTELCRLSDGELQSAVSFGLTADCKRDKIREIVKAVKGGAVLQAKQENEEELEEREEREEREEAKKKTLKELEKECDALKKKMNKQMSTIYMLCARGATGEEIMKHIKMCGYDVHVD